MSAGAELCKHLQYKPVFFKLGVARDFKFWIFRDYDDFGRKVAKYKINSKRRPFFFREHLDFGAKIAESEIDSR